MYLTLEHPAIDLPPFALARAKAAAEQSLAAAGLTLSELATALSAGKTPEPALAAKAAAVASLAVAGIDGTGLSLVIRVSGSAPPAAP